MREFTPEELYWYWAGSTRGLGAVRLRKLLETAEDLEQAFNDASIARSCLPESVANALISRANEDMLVSEVYALSKKGIDICTYASEDYPQMLKEISRPPVMLYVKGKLKADADYLAMVGTRTPTRRGEINARRFAAELSRGGLAIVSGMARGLDSAAHLGALDADGYTVAVLGSGVDVVYPKENAELYERISETGAVISEYAPGTRPDQRYFPARNRIISGMSLGVLLTEGERKSGSQITVAEAYKEGRDVFALPGDVSFPQSELPNSLIEEGAKIAATPATILKHYGLAANPMKRSAVREQELDGEEKEVYALLMRGDAAIDELVEELNKSAADVLKVLTMMELKGIVVRKGGSIFGINI